MNPLKQPGHCPPGSFSAAVFLFPVTALQAVQAAVIALSLFGAEEASSSSRALCSGALGTLVALCLLVKEAQAELRCRSRRIGREQRPMRWWESLAGLSCSQSLTRAWWGVSVVSGDLSWVAQPGGRCTALSKCRPSLAGLILLQLPAIHFTLSLAVGLKNCLLPPVSSGPTR